MKTLFIGKVKSGISRLTETYVLENVAHYLATHKSS